MNYVKCLHYNVITNLDWYILFTNKCDNVIICDVSGKSFSISNQSYSRKQITRTFDINVII